MAVPPPPLGPPGLAVPQQSLLQGAPPFPMAGTRPPLIPVPPPMMMGIPACQQATMFLCHNFLLMTLFRLHSASAHAATYHPRGTQDTDTPLLTSPILVPLTGYASSPRTSHDRCHESQACTQGTLLLHGAT